MGKVVQGTSFTFLYGDFPWKSLTVAYAKNCVCVFKGILLIVFCRDWAGITLLCSLGGSDDRSHLPLSK